MVFFTSHSYQIMVMMIDIIDLIVKEMIDFEPNVYLSLSIEDGAYMNECLS